MFLSVNPKRISHSFRQIWWILFEKGFIGFEIRRIQIQINGLLSYAVPIHQINNPDSDFPKGTRKICFWIHHKDTIRYSQPVLTVHAFPTIWGWQCSLRKIASFDNRKNQSKKKNYYCTNLVPKSLKSPSVCNRRPTSKRDETPQRLVYVLWVSDGRGGWQNILRCSINISTSLSSNVQELWICNRFIKGGINDGALCSHFQVVTRLKKTALILDGGYDY